MRPALLALLATLAACVRPGAPSPVLLEQEPLALRDDGALVLAELTAPGRVHLLLQGPRGSRTPLAEVPLDALAHARLDEALYRPEPTPLRAMLLAHPAVQERIAEAGARVAHPLAPVPNSRRRRFEVDGLALRIELGREGIAGTPLAAVWAGEGGTEVVVAETAITGRSWVGDAQRAGDRVVVAVGSLAGGTPLRRVQTLVSVRLGPARARVRNRLGHQRYAVGDVEGAARAWRAATEADPAFADVHYNLACALALLGEMRAAEEALARAHAADPVRVRDLARRDPDLALVRRLPQVRTLLALEPDAQ